MSMRARWTLPFSVLGLALFLWGVFSYQPYHLAVYRADQQFGSVIQDYRVAVSNKRYRNADLTVRIEGLPENSYSIP